MSTAGPSNMAEALELIDSGMRFLAGMNKAGMPCEALAAGLQALEWHDAVEAAARGEMLAAYDAQGGPVGDGQRTTKAWIVNTARVTRGQAAEHIAVQRLAEAHPVLRAALAEGDVISKSVALQLARWTAKIPDEHRDEAEKILVTAARVGADLRGLAAICAEIRRAVTWSTMVPRLCASRSARRGPCWSSPWRSACCTRAASAMPSAMRRSYRARSGSGPSCGSR
jgi:hypothetical protein